MYKADTSGHQKIYLSRSALEVQTPCKCTNLKALHLCLSTTKSLAASLNLGKKEDGISSYKNSGSRHDVSGQHTYFKVHFNIK